MVNCTPASAYKSKIVMSEHWRQSHRLVTYDDASCDAILHRQKEEDTFESILRSIYCTRDN